MDEPMDPAFVVMVAGWVLDSHRVGRRCQRCTDDGCDQPAWAQQVIDQARADRAAAARR